MWRPLPLWLCVAGIGLALSSSRADDASPGVAEARIVYLSDLRDRVLLAEQTWGVIGWDTAAHAPDKAGEPLRVAGRAFARGVGHHANGSLVLLLDGEFQRFESWVGVQPCEGGSVVFRVLVDGQVRYTSRVLRPADAAEPVSVDVADGQELRLEVGDAGDGITCDVADWCDARLVRSATSRPSLAEAPPPDMARFARWMTCDPELRTGTRALRDEEFPAEDLSLESGLETDRDGYAQAAVYDGPLACVGLEWLNRRTLRTLSLEFAAGLPEGVASTARVEAWTGESRWQGAWKPLSGERRAEANRLVLEVPATLAPGEPLHTWKVRWIWPSPGRHPRVRMHATTRSRWATAPLRVEWRPAESRRRRSGTAAAMLVVINGEVAEAPGSVLPLQEGITPLSVRYARADLLHSDPAVLQLNLGNAVYAVAVADVLTNACVYVPQAGLLVCRADRPVSIREYSKQITGRRSILEEVRRLPEQTLEQAMARTHHDFQEEGPVLLSLAGDNAKWVLEREGDLQFQVAPVTHQDWFSTAARLRVESPGVRPQGFSRTLAEGWLPIPTVTRLFEGWALHETVFVAPLEASGIDPLPLCVAVLTLSNTQPQAVEASVRLALQPPRGASANLWFSPIAMGGEIRFGTQMIGQLRLPDSSAVRAAWESDAVQVSATLAPGAREQLTLHLWDRPRGAPSSVNLVWPADRLTLRGARHLRDLPSPEALQRAAATHWRSLLETSMQIETPDPFLNDVIRSSQVRCLADARNEADGERVAPWIAAMSYGPLESEAHSVLRGMAFLGHEEFTRRGLDFFVHRYNTNGFLTTGYTTFGTGWHLWTLAEHWQLTRDTNWLRGVAPEVARVGRWIVAQTDKTRRAGGPAAGLMPPGVLADWNSYAFHFAMNAYYCVALRGVAAGLGDIGHPDAALFASAAERLGDDTLRAYRWTQAQSPVLLLRNGTWVPHYPSQLHSPGPLGAFFPGQDAGRAWAYDVELGAHQLVPTGLLDPHSVEVSRMLDHMEDVQFLGEGWFDYPAAANQADWFNLGGFSKVQPFYCRNAEIYAMRDDVKPFLRSYFNSTASLLNREVLTFWEHFRHSGAWDKTHETGYFLHQTRTMLLQERGNELWLAPFTPSAWLEDGRQVRVSQAPTRFGRVAYAIRSHLTGGRIEATVTPPTRSPVRKIVLRLRTPGGEPIRAVTINGRKHRGYDRDRQTVDLPVDIGPMEVQVLFERRKPLNPPSPFGLRRASR